MNIGITGASGLVGAELTPLLQGQGHNVVEFVRKEPQAAHERHWNPSALKLDPDALRDLDAIIHLAGENIGEGRWTPEKKRRIRDSRIIGTRLLAEKLAALGEQKPALICASAIGYYGNRGDEELTEDSPPGDGFLPDVCAEWEQAADPAREAGLRVVHLRLGIVLSPKGGALSKMMLPFKMCVGGIIGSGQQFWSWIALPDAVRLFATAATDERYVGPINAVSTNPPTNYAFTKTLGKVLSRPTIFPMPGFAAKLALGEMANDLLLASSRVLPVKLDTLGYEYEMGELEPALRSLLGKED